MIGSMELISAFVLDAAIGDPRWLPHPVRCIGRAISFLENRIRLLFGKTREKAAGVSLVLLIVVPAGGLAYGIREALLYPSDGLAMAAGMVVMVYLLATTIALRELVAAAGLVLRRIKQGDLDAARSSLSMIVGRDTSRLDEEGVLRAVVETVAENLCDGVIAPLLYLVIGGLPCAITYKAINTLDSMVGYKNEKYISFGWAAARLDDIANYVPARISGMLIVIGSFCYFLVVQPGSAWPAALRSFRIMKRDGRNHTSPNSGISEAAMAGSLGVRLGGPSTYGGVLVQKPFIGDSVNGNYRAAAEDSIRIVIAASVAGVLASLRLLKLRTAA